MNKAPRKCIAYARFSPRPNADESDADARQLEHIREYAKANNLEIIEEHSDRGISGNSVDRPGLWTAIDNLKRGYALICWHPDRLARSVYLFEYLRRVITDCGAHLMFVVGDTDDTMEGRLMRQILTSIAEYQRQVIAMRTRLAMRRKSSVGMVLVRGRPPYGWKPNPDPQKASEIDGDQQKAMRYMHELREKGHSWQSIADVLNQEGIKPPINGAKEWYAMTVYRIVNRMNAGDKRYARPETPKRVRRKRSQREMEMLYDKGVQ